jgi:uncharacterized protein YbjT (DUF2867 family)
MYAIMGATARTGTVVANALLDAGHKVRVIVRDAAKGASWPARGVEVAIADWTDADALKEAFAGAEGVYVMVPPVFTPSSGFPETKAVVAALRTALAETRPGRVVALSSVGAHRKSGLGLITQSHIMEQELGALGIPVAFIRAASFMENEIGSLQPARDQGEIAAYRSPDHAIPMVATADIGRVAAEILQQTWSGTRRIELEGPRPYSPADVAAVYARLLGRPVRAAAVPRSEWSARFAAAGLPTEGAGSWFEMLEGFDTGWITFEGDGCEHVVGTTALDEVLARAVGAV